MTQVTLWTIDVSTSDGSFSSCWYRLVAELHAYLPDLKRHTPRTTLSREAEFLRPLFLIQQVEPNGTAERLIEPFISRLEAANSMAKFTSNISWAPA